MSRSCNVSFGSYDLLTKPQRLMARVKCNTSSTLKSLDFFLFSRLLFTDFLFELNCLFTFCDGHERERSWLVKEPMTSAQTPVIGLSLFAWKFKRPKVIFKANDRKWQCNIELYECFVVCIAIALGFVLRIWGRALKALPNQNCYKELS